MADLAHLLLDENEEHVAACCRVAAVTSPIVDVLWAEGCMNSCAALALVRALSVAVGS